MYSVVTYTIIISLAWRKRVANFFRHDYHLVYGYDGCKQSRTAFSVIAGIFYTSADYSICDTVKNERPTSLTKH